jgi:DNA-binding GntR family transcriptional regulator
MIDPAAATLASSRVANALREAILTGEIAPGDRVRQEELAAEYGISRIPVREALRLLESEGLVVLVPNSGAWVAKLDQTECVEIYKIRERLEPLALAESCGNLSEETLSELSAIAAKIEIATNTDEFLRLDRQFHLMSYSGARMPQLLEMIYKFWNTTQHYRRAFAFKAEQSSMMAVYYEHALIMEALHRRDGEHAARVLQDHIRRTRLKLEEHSELFT